MYKIPLKLTNNNRRKLTFKTKSNIKCIQDLALRETEKAYHARRLLKRHEFGSWYLS